MTNLSTLSRLTIATALAALFVAKLAGDVAQTKACHVSAAGRCAVDAVAISKVKPEGIKVKKAITYAKHG